MKYHIKRLTEGGDPVAVGETKGYHTRKAALHAIKHQMKLLGATYMLVHPQTKPELFRHEQ